MVIQIVVSAASSAEWDNFSQPPTFWNSRYGWINVNPGITLVGTESDSSLEIDDEVFNGIEEIARGRRKMALVDQKVEELKSFKRTIKAELDLFTADDITLASIILIDGHFESVKKWYVKMAEAVEDLKEIEDVDANIVHEWDQNVKDCQKTITENKAAIIRK